MSSLPCRNCGALAPGKYCSECGQSTALHPPSAGEFLHEFIGHHIALEGKLWATLGNLLFRPGSLTVAYFAGRKLRYVNPLRLYLSISLILFAVAGLVKPEVKISRIENSGKLSAPLSHEETERLARDAVASIHFVPAWAKAHADHFLGLTYEQQAERLGHDFGAYSPYALFLLVPALALLLKLFYLRRRLYYGEHLVCALHLQTAAFIFALADVTVVPDGGQSLMQLAFLTYSGLALQRVYGCRSWATIARVLVLGFIYMMLFSFMVMLMLAISIFL